MTTSNKYKLNIEIDDCILVDSNNNKLKLKDILLKEIDLENSNILNIKSYLINEIERNSDECNKKFLSEELKSLYNCKSLNDLYTIINVLVIIKFFVKTSVFNTLLNHLNNLILNKDFNLITKKIFNSKNIDIINSFSIEKVKLLYNQSTKAYLISNLFKNGIYLKKMNVYSIQFFFNYILTLRINKIFILNDKLLINNNDILINKSTIYNFNFYGLSFCIIYGLKNIILNKNIDYKALFKSTIIDSNYVQDFICNNSNNVNTLLLNNIIQYLKSNNYIDILYFCTYKNNNRMIIDYFLSTLLIKLYSKEVVDYKLDICLNFVNNNNNNKSSLCKYLFELNFSIFEILFFEFILHEISILYITNNFYNNVDILSNNNDLLINNVNYCNEVWSNIQYVFNIVFKIYSKLLIMLDFNKFKDNLKSLDKEIISIVNINSYLDNNNNLELSKKIEETRNQYIDIYNNICKEIIDCNKYKIIFSDLVIFPYGSITQMLGDKKSDIDLFIQFKSLYKKFNYNSNNNNIIILKKAIVGFLNYISKKNNTKESINILTLMNKKKKNFNAKKYLNVVLSNRLLTIPCYNIKYNVYYDVNMCGEAGIFNSFYIYILARINPIFWILSMYIKKIKNSLKLDIFDKNSLINNNNNNNSNHNNKKLNYKYKIINSYTWNLLLISFLQNGLDNPVLPKIISSKIDSNLKEYVYIKLIKPDIDKNKIQTDLDNNKCYLNNSYIIQEGVNAIFKGLDNNFSKSEISSKYFKTSKVFLELIKMYCYPESNINYNIINNIINFKSNNTDSPSLLFIKFLEFVININSDIIYIDCHNEEISNLSDIDCDSVIYNTMFKNKRDYNKSSFGLIIRDPFDHNYNPSDINKSSFFVLQQKIKDLYIKILENGTSFCINNANNDNKIIIDLNCDNKSNSDL